MYLKRLMPLCFYIARENTVGTMHVFQIEGLREELQQSENDRKRLYSEVENLQDTVKEQLEQTMAEVSCRVSVSDEIADLQQMNAQLTNDMVRADLIDDMEITVDFMNMLGLYRGYARYWYTCTLT